MHYLKYEAISVRLSLLTRYLYFVLLQFKNADIITLTQFKFTSRCMAIPSHVMLSMRATAGSPFSLLSLAGLLAILFKSIAIMIPILLIKSIAIPIPIPVLEKYCNTFCNTFWSFFICFGIELMNSIIQTINC